MKELLGGKGAGLAEMTRIGLPVPAGLTITTETCDYYLKHDHKYPKELAAQVDADLKRLERDTDSGRAVAAVGTPPRQGDSSD